MAKRISRFKLGLFFLIGVAITLGGLVWAGLTYFFQPSQTYVTFFNESVQGLGPGAGVSYRGVKVGRVNSVGIAPDGKLIRVELKISPDFNVDSKAVELKPGGITGQPYLALDAAPADLEKLTPKITFPHKYPLIPSLPGEVQIMEAFNKIYKKINSLDLNGLVSSWKKTGQHADALITDKDIRRTIRNLREISADIEKLANMLGKPGTRRKVQQVLTDLAGTVAAAQKSSKDLASQLEHLPPGAVGDIATQVEFTISQINQVLTSLKGMVHELREEPGKILVIPKGKEPFQR
ncbi:MAG: MlaD family protein [Syntrophobacterales bacterium]|jgi:ABC-type transporter Mla subunit MlaD